MNYDITVTEVEPTQIAAVRARYTRPTLSSVLKTSLDQVWEFLHSAPHLPHGHNVVIYDGPSSMLAGVQAPAPFEPSANVVRAATPRGRAAHTLHRGPYAEIGHANEAILAWCRDHNEQPTGISWEIYGDWVEDEADLTTEVYYQLA